MASGSGQVSGINASTTIACYMIDSWSSYWVIIWVVSMLRMLRSNETLFMNFG